MKLQIAILILALPFLAISQDMGCDDERLNVESILGKGSKLKSGLVDSLKVISFCLVTDIYTRDGIGSDAETLEWLRGNYDQLALYLNREGISTALTGLRIKDIADGLNASFDVLNEFGNVVRDSLPGREKVFITMKGNQQGVAWLNTFAYNYSYYAQNDWHIGPYAVIMGANYNPLSFWNTMGIVHEVGHNLGANHTHACVWGPNSNQAIDNCVPTEGSCSVIEPQVRNTIMSYCHINGGGGIDLNKGFGQLVNDRISTLIDGAGRDLNGYEIIKANITGNLDYNIETRESVDYYNISVINNKESTTRITKH